MTPEPAGLSLPDWPLYGWADDVRPAMAEAVAANEPFALVTLLEAEGGAPRPPGTQMLIGADRLSGFLSGGCVEGDVAAHARASLADGQPRRLIYGEGSPYPDIRLLCGGRIELLVEPIQPGDAAVATLLQGRAERRPVLYQTDGRVRSAALEPGPDLKVGPGLFHVKHWSYPRSRLIVVGADPTALAIAALGSQTSFETWLVRPKGPSDPPPLAGVAYDRRAAPDALEAIGLDPWTFVAIATHELESDEAALAAALPSPARYVGVLGARRRLPERLARLRALGVREPDLARLHAPIGLDLGGKAPFEIAVSVLAEIIGERQGAPARRTGRLKPVEHEHIDRRPRLGG